MRRNDPVGWTTALGVGIAPLSEGDIDAVHLATLEVLERTGAYVEDEQALDLLADAGCAIDREKHVVKIPAHVVGDALASCPPAFWLCGRSETRDVLLGASRVGFITFCEGILMNDLESGENRPSRKSDVADICRLVDALPEIDAVASPVGARDVGEAAPSVHGLEAMLTSTTKHVHIPLMSRHEAEAAVEMAALVAGGGDAFRERPLVSGGCATVSPLRLTRQFTDVAAVLARAGMPMLVISGVIAGATAPVTLAGCLVSHNAEMLASLVFVQLAERGAKVIYGSFSAAMDMRFGVDCVGTPEMSLLSACLPQLCRRYGIPTWMAGL